MRRMLAALAATLALAAPAVAADPGQPAEYGARPNLAAIAPGGNITSVVQQTAAVGWPHYATANEQNDVVAVALVTSVPPNRAGAVTCHFGWVLGKVTCKVTVGVRKPRSFRIRMTIFEDGSWSTVRVRPRRS